ncbi:alpha/beta hydrolase fold domain-containing protein [Novosphingobium sp. FSY-8]|uniref:Alpha/beta hydrolase fold domain-containing protein n=2 Tax=Novosphingobium ovatum TaxID=1908523 RepID=A0ABW9XCB9_9SPHN|nr:alpha/beta hydrolase fold domain-containing protein [Novosphingobium ovatum]
MGLIPLAPVATGAWAQPPATKAPPPVMAPGVIGAPAGSGAYPAVAEARADARGYTIYRPANWPAGKLPLVLWGNGGCRDNGLSASYFLREVASHGYVVIANGAAREERPALAQLPAANGPTPLPPGGPVAPPRGTPDETSVDQLLAAIDWVKGTDLASHVDPANVAVMGHSCGGLQAIAAGADPRIKTVVALNSGVYIRADTGLSGVHLVKDDLKKLHTPIAYVLGGPQDIAYPNGTDDVSRIAHVPVFLASMPVGHGGTFALANGGAWGQVATAWLDWQLKGNASAARQFVGRDCGLCKDQRWTVSAKNFPEKP